MEYKILDKIDSPSDIKGLSLEELKELCAEIRAYLVECCAQNPGHLGSSLGAVELIVGMHYVFNAPADKFVFDVSHQSYAHKILTGRKEAFRTGNRRKGGISGFTRRDESPYDAFGAGHSSTSISAALGLAQSNKLQGLDDKVVALIGDGSLTGGMAFEGLNNAGGGKTDLLVILNDNNKSIDDNIGGLHTYLLNLTTGAFYNTMKNRVWNILGDGKFRRSVQDFVVHCKSALVHRSGGDLFEALGFRYFGPIDGNDIEAVVNALLRLKDLRGPRILHTFTKKGKGYAPAEEDQTTWHAPGLFDPVSGRRIKVAHKESRYQDVFGEVLLELARKDSRIVGVTPAMASGCGMNLLSAEMPDRFFDVGIAEEHAVTFSAGLAAGGMLPFCNIYSSFAQRAYDQIIHDVALQGLHVVLCLDRAGLVGEDGATHHGVFDLAAFRSVPGAVICAPRNEIELKNLMYTATLHKGSPFIIRYPRGWAEGDPWRETPYSEIPLGTAEKLITAPAGLAGLAGSADGSVGAAGLAGGSVDGSVGAAGLVDGSVAGSVGAAGRPKVAILAMGPFANRAAEAANDFIAAHGFGPDVWNVRFLKPFDPAMLAEHYDIIVTVEDGVLRGGLFSEVSETVSRLCPSAASSSASAASSASSDAVPSASAASSASDSAVSSAARTRVVPIGIPDRFIHQGTQSELRSDCSLTRDTLLSTLISLYSL